MLQRPCCRNKNKISRLSTSFNHASAPKKGLLAKLELF